MPVAWTFASKAINLQGTGRNLISTEDAERQTTTAQEILRELRGKPGILLADEVGMGKTYVALAVAASVILSNGGKSGPVVIMVPSRLKAKWQWEWQSFQAHCSSSGLLEKIRSTYVGTPTEFFKALHAKGGKRPHLIFLTTGCFSRGWRDPFVKLAMVKVARKKFKANKKQLTALYKYLPIMLRQVSVKAFSPSLVRDLMETKLSEWSPILRSAELCESGEDPVPTDLVAIAERLDWSGLVNVLKHEVPQQASPNLRARLKLARSKFTEACRGIYKEWLRHSHWRSPLLILDEAHHAKNDSTELARLFREGGEEEIAVLGAKFDRCLFLTATPFQLGHEELIRILDSFRSIRWTGVSAPDMDQSQFVSELGALEDALDTCRLQGRHLDELWGKLLPEQLAGRDLMGWWTQLSESQHDTFERRLRSAFGAAEKAKQVAQVKLRPWVIRHNRPTLLPYESGEEPQPRRRGMVGRCITDMVDPLSPHHEGLPIEQDAILPFLLTARVQGEMASIPGARAYFAEGLASSYEAFHHTRDGRQNARDTDDYGQEVTTSSQKVGSDRPKLAIDWYEQRIAELIPSRIASREQRLAHPKVAFTVRRVADLWEMGEKVLVFCYYRETTRALFDQIEQEINQRILRMASLKFGAPDKDPAALQDLLRSVARRFSDPRSPYRETLLKLLNEVLNQERYTSLKESHGQCLEVLAAYFRSPSFIVRYLPLDDSNIRESWLGGKRRSSIIEKAQAALISCITEYRDGSNQTLVGRFEQFLDYAVELSERPTVAADDDNLTYPDPLKRYLESVTTTAYEKAEGQDASNTGEPSTNPEDARYRVVPLVRMVFGDTPQETRERLALSFNSPLFPEILVSSVVMGEGIDLHRFCRHVIHHDGYWNPSTLEQQTGRLDRIRCKAEICRRSIVIHQPFIAGSADEKMFRVLRDRDRWFQIVMGQKFEFDEGKSEAIASRVPLPDELAKRLMFDLSRWQACSSTAPPAGDRHG